MAKSVEGGITGDEGVACLVEVIGELPCRLREIELLEGLLLSLWLRG